MKNDHLAMVQPPLSHGVQQPLIQPVPNHGGVQAEVFKAAGITSLPGAAGDRERAEVMRMVPVVRSSG